MLQQFNVLLRTMAIVFLFAAGEGEETELSKKFNAELIPWTRRWDEPSSSLRSVVVIL